MKTKFQLCLVMLLIGVASTMLDGCASSMRVLSSTPPVKSFVMERPAEFKVGWGGRMTFPAGEYKPVMEDNDGYYYQAPSKVVARGFGALLADNNAAVSDGGLYVSRGETTPSRWYVIDPESAVHTYELPNDFQVKESQ